MLDKIKSFVQDKKVQENAKEIGITALVAAFVYGIFKAFKK